ncbi:MAG: NUDIX hydrolase [Candidatus Poseidonia sp.]|nr:NUDIX hydrolase [Poseidonia sp.]
MPEENPVFVLGWMTVAGEPTTQMGKGGKVLFVRHPKRGWEIPGGHLEEGESPEDALLRELFEETGLKGKLQGWNTNYYPEGWVGHVIVEATELEFWEADDDNVSEVRWWSQTPPLIQWTEEEFEDLATWFSQSV